MLRRVPSPVEIYRQEVLTASIIWVIAVMMEAESTSETSISFYQTK
jgi:hypothetical protein